MDQAEGIGAIRCFVGIPVDSAVTADSWSGISFESYCGTGVNSRLYAKGRLSILPAHYSTLPELLRNGHRKADVLLVQLSPPNSDGDYVLGVADDYFSAAIDTARVVIGEINPSVPRTSGARVINRDRLAAVIDSQHPVAAFRSPEIDAATAVAAGRIAELIDDGVTVQAGIGALPAAVLRALSAHRELGIHSGVLTDEVVDLLESGAVTGSRKSRDTGIVVGGLLMGTERLLRAAADPRLSLRSTGYTHNPEVLASSTRLTAVNSALEVDLTGQVNAESVGGRYVGAVGGAVDFIRGAARSDGGKAIIGLTSTSGGRSSIVPELSGPVSTPRSEPTIVVTENGTADLRGLTLEERVTAMITIADPHHRAELDGIADSVLAISRQRKVSI